MMALNSERLDAVEMYWRLCSNAVPALGWVGLGWSLSTWAAEPKAAYTGVGWWCAGAAAAEFAEEVAEQVAEDEVGGTAPCTP